ncbi:glucan biosynthesis protein D [Paracoccus caeni]|uniref:Glucan biosynthesis protein D n=1 Tax=Paracoccus caeni TaxID=657651 RepID=A0A934SGS0_9RHOB|nr:glucan biosynthesis protein D [Paracoccus caeni]MBK4215107.1 glucan biosynthesis protein D [Paracoccus caeni]
MQNHQLHRRALLQTALGSGAFFLLPKLALAQSADPASAEPFSFDILTDLARELASQPFQPAEIPDAAVLEEVDYDRHNSITFKKENTLWRDREGSSQVQMFFPGRYFKEPVRIFQVENGQATEVPFDLDLFDIPDDNPAHQLTHTKGFAGFRVLDPETQLDWMAFLGASYWRTSGYTGQFGLSVRGLAIDTALPEGPEEFPRFSRFWLEPGENGDMTAYALMESASVTGAYRIVSHRDNGVIQDVTARVFTRADVQRIGFAPLTSMYWYGKTNPHIAPDWRPEIHDSDGLQILSGNGESIWRPLNNPPYTMVNSFASPSVKGFGLMQRERDFDQYQDDGVFYERRASAWVAPQGDWGDGAVVLTELRTDDEIHDNIVAFWQPADPATAGKDFELDYRLTWLEDSPEPVTTGRFIGIRLGAGGVPGQPRPEEVVKVVCDFDAAALKGLGREDGVTLNVNTSKGITFNDAVYPVESQDYWRAMFDIDFGDLTEDERNNPIDLRVYVSHEDQAVTETLILQLFPQQLRSVLESNPG